VTLSMGGDSSACGGFNAPQIQLMVNGLELTYNLGKDLFKFTPLDSASTATSAVNLGANPEYLQVLPVPVPAGPLGSASFGPFIQQPAGTITVFKTGQFGIETPALPTSPFSLSSAPTPRQACVPIASFSGGIGNGSVAYPFIGRDPNSLPIAGATLNPACPELQLDCLNAGGTSACGDAVNFHWSGTLGTTVDPIVGAGIGGVHSLTQHSTGCPTTTFSLDTLVSYTGDPPSIDFPSRLGNSCIVDTYEPGTNITPNGTTFGLFQGFQLPVLNCPTGPGCSGLPQNEKSGSSIPLIFVSQTSAGIPLTPPAVGTPSLQWCTDNTIPTPPKCTNLPGVGTPADPNTFWVWFGFIPTACSSGVAIGTPLADAGSSSLQYQGPPSGSNPAGTWQFNWKTTGIPVGSCATPLLIFNTGMEASDYAVFKFTH
jgi:hypothetical protein